MPVARYQLPDGRIARVEVPEGTTPEQAQAMAAQYFAQNPPESANANMKRQASGQPQAQEPAPDKSLYQKANDALRPAFETGPGAVLGEFMSAVNRGAINLAEFFTSDQINAIMQLAGSDKRVPGVGDSDLVRGATQGNYMDEGLARDVVRTGGEFVPAAVASGALIRNAASRLPAVTSSESVARGAIRQAASTTAGQDAVIAAQAGAGTVLGGEAGEAVGGDRGRLIGSALGSMAVPAVASTVRPAAAETARRAFRGTEQGRQRLAESISNFAEIDRVPSLGQGTGDGFRQGMENLSARILGGGPIRKAVESTSNAMQTRLAQIADDLSPVRGDVETGRVIQRGITGDDGFVARWSKKSGELWGALDQRIPKTEKTKIENTYRALEDIVNTGKLGEVLNNPQMSRLKTAIDDAIGPIQVSRPKTSVSLTPEDASYSVGSSGVNRAVVPRTLSRAEIAPDGTEVVALRSASTGKPVLRDTISYGELARLRSMVGQKLGSKELVSDIPRAELKKLYAAMSRDVEEIARAQGDEVYKSWQRANNFTRSGHKRIDDFVDRVASKVDLDRVYQAVARGGEGTQSLNAIKRSLKPDEWEAVAANVTRNLGKASAGQQDDLGAEFSVNKFLTDWNKLGPSRNVLFSGSNRLNSYRENMNRIAAAANDFKQSAQQMANPSGTAQFLTNIGIVSGAGSSLATGNLPTFGLLMGGVAANNGAARLMTNPKFVQWLAKSTTVKDWPAHIAMLPAIAKSEGLDSEVAELTGTLEQAIPERSRPQQAQ